MKQIARQAVLAALTSVAVTASLTVGATSAFAINEGTCSRSDFLQITIHRPGENSQMRCYANAGEAKSPQTGGSPGSRPATTASSGSGTEAGSPLRGSTSGTS